MSLSNHGDEIVDGETTRTRYVPPHLDAVSRYADTVAALDREERHAQALADSQDAAAASMLSNMRTDALRDRFRPG